MKIYGDGKDSESIPALTQLCEQDRDTINNTLDRNLHYGCVELTWLEERE